METSDLPRYFPTETDLGSFGQVILREVPKGTPLTAIDQPFRQRTLFVTPDNIPARVSFMKPKGIDAETRSANLRDLVLNGTGVTQERLAEVLIDGGLEPILPPERYKSNPDQTTPELVYQDASTTWTGHALREQGLLPEPGVMQARRDMPEPHASRRPNDTRRWS